MLRIVFDGMGYTVVFMCNQDDPPSELGMAFALKLSPLCDKTKDDPDRILVGALSCSSELTFYT